MANNPKKQAQPEGAACVKSDIKFFSSSSRGWSKISVAATDGDEAKNTAESVRNQFERHLTDIMLAENLVVLTGLGTSLCVKNEKGEVAAPKLKDLWVAAEKEGGAKFKDIQKKVKYETPANGDNIEALLSKCQIYERLNSDADVSTFIKNAEKAIVGLCRFVKKETTLDVHEAFLRRIARRSTRLPRVKIFTTNYDLCFETASSRTRFIVIDGFSHTNPQAFDGINFSYDFVQRDGTGNPPNYVPNLFQMYKLHGSVDWQKNGAHVEKNPNATEPLIIYPRDSKFESSYDQPFFEMMSSFQMALRQHNTALLVIGFGFNDHHICQPIRAAINSNVNLKALVVDPKSEEMTKSDGLVKDASSLIEHGDSRLGLLSASFEDLVPFIPDLIASTEDEKHLERLGKLLRDK